jgi:hypothetical protein
MATYVYETIPADPSAPKTRFEIKQSMKDPALEKHPETGEPVRRVISGGYGYLSSSKAPPAAPVKAPGHGGGGCGHAGCGCGH